MASTHVPLCFAVFNLQAHRINLLHVVVVVLVGSGGGGGCGGGGGGGGRGRGGGGDDGGGGDIGGGGDDPGDGGSGGPAVSETAFPEEGCNEVHDRLWCGAALDFLKLLHSDRLEAGQPPLIFSLGPHLRIGASSCFATLSSVTNPDPPVAAGDDLSFNIEAGNGHDTADNLDRQSAASEGDVPHDTAWASDVMFSTLFKSNPEQAVVAHIGPSVKGSSLCVSLVHVQHVDTDAERVTVHLEGPIRVCRK